MCQYTFNRERNEINTNSKFKRIAFLGFEYTIKVWDVTEKPVSCVRDVKVDFIHSGCGQLLCAPLWLTQCVRQTWHMGHRQDKGCSLYEPVARKRKHAMGTFSPGPYVPPPASLALPPSYGFLPGLIGWGGPTPSNPFPHMVIILTW